MNQNTSNMLLYDDGCPLCTFQMRIITWLDWFNIVSLVPLSHPDAKLIAPQLSREQLLEAVHCVMPTGRVLRGARALRFLFMRMPLLIPVGLFLWLPGVIWVAEIVYNAVSRNRHLLSKLFGCKEACSIMPTRKREGDVKQADS